ncbi:MAG: SUMF1/EgtB/PvdO family nonheme iron enzyme [Blastocatellia bacterium]
MNADQPTNERHARGQEMVEEFLHRFAEKADYRALACHAALPLMLTPDLLKYLRHEFMPHLSWVAEVDLLLSKLCDEAAEGVYVMKRDARACLIRRMREDEALGEDRIEIVNRMLIERLDYLARNHPAILPHEWRTQRLSAMLYVTERRDEAARELGKAIYRCLTDNVGEAGKAGAVARQTELARLTRLVREEAANLQDNYPDLAQLAQLTGQIIADRSHQFVEQLRESGQLSQQFHLPGVDAQLPLLEYVVAGRQIQAQAVLRVFGGRITAQATLLQTEEKHGAEVKPFAKSPEFIQSSGFKYSCYLNYHAEGEIANRFAGHFQNALTRELSSLGVDKPIFVASRNLASGPFYSESLSRALYESACYIALWSPVEHGNKSLELELESARLLEEKRFRLAGELLGESLKERSLILPLILGAPESAPEALRNIQWIDFSKTITSPRWFSTKDFRSRIRSIAEFVLNCCRGAERIPEAFADPQDFALQVEAADLIRQAREAMHLGQYDEAHAELARALKIQRDRQDRDGEILALNDAGELSYSVGDFDQALRYYSEALDIARSIDARSHVAMLLDNLGLFYAATNESEQALRSYQESLEIFRELGDKNGEAAVLGNLGLLLLAQGETQRAIEYFEQQLKLSEETGYELQEGIALGNIGIAYSRLGQSQTAIDFYQRAAPVFEGLGAIGNQADALYQLSRELKKLGRRQEAIGYAQRALELYELLRVTEAEDARALLAELQNEMFTTLDRADRYKLVEALLECDCMKTPQSRDQVVVDLPPEIGSKINRNLNNKLDVMNIVQACLQFKGGMEGLFASVEFYEGKNALSWRKVLEVKQEILANARSAEQLGQKLAEALQASGGAAAPNLLQAAKKDVEVDTRPASIILSPFEFETVTLDERGEVKERRKLRASQFLEELASNVALAMVEIPGGKFMMGSPKNEAERFGDESPQHEVTVPPFYIGKFAITQAEWRVVAGWEKVERELKPDPSFFKGDDRPVESVNWQDAKEFCARLAKKTGRPYRLPSEAEWEYACRAGTTTPFASGENITPEVVNYNGNYPYAKAKKGKYRGETIPVGSLGVANAFGLFDMHGNVWEWCEDVYHNYNGAPTDGSVWLSGGDSSYRVLRGGSWYDDGGHCRAAIRLWFGAGARDDDFCFRVVVSARTS